jgi:hypothetical protein
LRAWSSAVGFSSRIASSFAPEVSKAAMRAS